MRTGQGSVQSAPFQPSLTPLSPEVTAGIRRLRKTRPSSMAALSVWPVQKYSTSLDLSFCICKTGMIMEGLPS